MGRSVSYPSNATVVTFSNPEYECEACEAEGYVPCEQCEGSGQDGGEECEACVGQGTLTCTACDGYMRRSMDSDDFDMLIDDFRSHLKTLFPSVVSADDWIDREDHVLAENRLARFGMSEYCGLVAYWIVPNEHLLWSRESSIGLGKHWIASIADKFVAAFGELSKVGTASNGESFYRRIERFGGVSLPETLRFEIDGRTSSNSSGGAECFYRIVGHRQPREGEFYISGAIPEAYRARADYSSAYLIVEPTHYAKRVQRFERGEPVKL